MLINDGDAAVAEIGLIVSLAMQVDDLDAHEARRLRAEIYARLAGLQAALADEATIRFKGDGNNVPHALDEITRARSALRALETAVASRLGDQENSQFIGNFPVPIRWSA
jgi:hypothetical protein